MTAKPIPEGYHTLTPYLIVNGGADALDFYARAFGAVELYRLQDPSGKVGHAEMRIGDSQFMLADECPEMGAVSPRSPNGQAFSLLLYVPDVDDAFRRAIAAGATDVYPVKDQFYGDRSGALLDPFGHKWSLATHVADVPPEEIGRRYEEMIKQGA